MAPRIQSVAVLGAGVMGARIAAHFINAGLRPSLLDIVPAELTDAEKKKGLTLTSAAVRNRIVRAGWEAALKAKPAALFRPDWAARIRLGNFDDHLEWLAEADWIIEAVAEDPAIKRSLLERVEHVRRPGTIVSSNTSGLPLRQIAEGRSEEFRRHWLGTHFFNPPRYMRLLEVIPVADTLPEVVAALSELCDRTLGKVVVRAKDTPNFIANRIGTFAMMNILRLMQEMDFTIEEVDEFTGPVLGLPRSATFRTADIVGLDVLASVVRNLYANVPEDERREVFRLPAFVETLLARRSLGEKTGGGFYQRIKRDAGSEILTFDWKTLDYRPRQRPQLPALELARNLDPLGERLQRLLAGRDRVAHFYHRQLSDLFHYAASRIPEIADSPAEIDAAMRYGFNWERGPFELWDLVGVEFPLARWQEEERPVPPLVEKLLAAGKNSFYARADSRPAVFALAVGGYQPLALRPGVIFLRDLKEQTRTIRSNAGASLIDLGDGVACLEFHTKMNSIGGDIIQMMNVAVEEVGKNFEGLVIANQAPNFSVGANLVLLLVAAQEGEWEEIGQVVRAFQSANMALKYASRPVVVAPHGMALGGGCEIALHATRLHAVAELYLGLVETGAGLIPAGGGTKEMVLRTLDSAQSELERYHHLRHTFETLAMAKVSTSAEEARQLGFLSEGDLVTMNLDRLVADAKESVLALARGYRPPQPRSDIVIGGEEMLAAFQLGIHLMRRADYITDYEAHIASKLASVMAGGDLNPSQPVSEQYLLDLEREAFVSLCGEPKTQERIQSILKRGKPVRN
ncbi:MAG: 3-hydroxyacyl-CoA dehydrogenase NAD-binding domain-containing protein [Terriglobia bacterium]